jgi:hypothetical protein
MFSENFREKQFLNKNVDFVAKFSQNRVHKLFCIIYTMLYSL